jgi:hypothetical protein
MKTNNPLLNFRDIKEMYECIDKMAYFDQSKLKDGLIVH